MTTDDRRRPDLRARRLEAVARQWFGNEVAERYLLPAVADFQHEVHALEDAGQARRLFVTVRGYAAFWRTAAACALIAGRRGVPAAMPTLSVPVLMAVCSLTVLLMADPALRMAPVLWTRLGAAGAAVGAATLLPQALVVAVPVGLLFGGFVAHRRKQQLTPLVLAESVLAMSLVGAVLSATLMAAAPAANQAFREIASAAAAHWTAPPPKGAAEMTTPELLEARRQAEGHPRQQALYDLYRHQKLAIPSAALAFGLVTIALGRRPSSHPLLMSSVLTILVTFLYYVLLFAGRRLALNLVLAPWIGAWGANLLFVLAASSALSLRVRRVRVG